MSGGKGREGKAREGKGGKGRGGECPLDLNPGDATAQHIHQKKPRLRDRTERAWFSRLVRHPARKQSGSILTTPEPARGERKKTGKRNKLRGAM